MEKKILKIALEGLQKDADIEINFIGNAGGGEPGAKKGSTRGIARSGKYRVIESKRGRGKKGSQLVLLLDVATNKNIEIGTPCNEEILNIVLPDGTKIGNASEADLPRNFKKTQDLEAAAKLKTILKPFLKMPMDVTKVQIESTVPEFNGVFAMTSCKLNVGRFGQISMGLKSDDGKEWTLWSHNHAEVIQSIKMV